MNSSKFSLLMASIICWEYTIYCDLLINLLNGEGPIHEDYLIANTKTWFKYSVVFDIPYLNIPPPTIEHIYGLKVIAVLFLRVWHKFPEFFSNEFFKNYLKYCYGSFLSLMVSLLENKLKFAEPELLNKLVLVIENCASSTWWITFCVIFLF